MDICADILTIARGGAKKTHLVYKANLNFNIVKKYIKQLTEKQLISSENGHFVTTEEGVRFLEKYREFMGMYSNNSEKMVGNTQSSRFV
jgi:predicted transcriptional regulator